MAQRMAIGAVLSKLLSTHRNVRRGTTPEGSPVRDVSCPFISVKMRLHMIGKNDQISTNSNLSAPVLDDTVNGLTVTVPSYGVYYWRVRGHNGTLISAWSSVQTFTVAPP